MTWDWRGLTDAESVRDIATRLSQPAQVVPFGIPGIDSHLWYWGDRRGIPRGEYAVFAGASNSGKTQLGLFMLKQAALAGEKGAIISLEMHREDILLRMFQGMTDIPSSEWIPSKWTSRHTTTLALAVQEWAEKVPGSIAINGGFTADLDAIVDEINIAIDQGITFFVIDHLQLIRVAGYSADQVTSRVEIASETLRNLAFGNRVTIVALSQLTISASRDMTTSPDMYSTWGGMPVSANASLVICADHTRYEKVDLAPHLARTWLNFSKNRMGPKGLTVPVLWNHAALTLTEALPHEEHLWPTHD